MAFRPNDMFGGGGFYGGAATGGSQSQPRYRSFPSQGFQPQGQQQWSPNQLFSPNMSGYSQPPSYGEATNPQGISPNGAPGARWTPVRQMPAGPVDMSAYSQGPSAGFGRAPQPSRPQAPGTPYPSDTMYAGGSPNFDESTGRYREPPAAQPIRPQGTAPGYGNPNNADFRTADWRDSDGDGIDDGDQRGPGQPLDRSLWGSGRQATPPASFRQGQAQPIPPQAPGKIYGSGGPAPRQTPRGPMPLPGGGNFFTGYAPGQQAFSMQTIGMDGSQMDLNSALAQRDAYIQALNSAAAPFAVARANGQNIGPPMIDQRAIMRQANEAVKGGYSNPFSDYFNGGQADQLIARLQQTGYPVGGMMPLNTSSLQLGGPMGVRQASPREGMGSVEGNTGPSEWGREMTDEESRPRPSPQPQMPAYQSGPAISGQAQPIPPQSRGTPYNAMPPQPASDQRPATTLDDRDRWISILGRSIANLRDRLLEDQYRPTTMLGAETQAALERAEDEQWALMKQRASERGEQLRGEDPAVVRAEKAAREKFEADERMKIREIERVNKNSDWFTRDILGAVGGPARANDYKMGRIDDVGAEVNRVIATLPADQRAVAERWRDLTDANAPDDEWRGAMKQFRSLTQAARAAAQNSPGSAQPVARNPALPKPATRRYRRGHGLG